MKKLRLLVTERCNRNCPKCCNQFHDLKNIPTITDSIGELAEYDEIMLTGGEPALEGKLCRRIIWLIRSINPKAKVYMYTAEIFQFPYELFSMLDGVTLTLHNQSDVDLFLYYKRAIEFYLAGKSNRLFVFSDLNLDDNDACSEHWTVRRIQWQDDCPLPDGEVLKRWND